MATLDIEAISRLYEYGALMAYEVEWFDVVTFRMKHERMTFNEEKAKTICDQYLKGGHEARIRIIQIDFDGAFSIKPKEGATG